MPRILTLLLFAIGGCFAAEPWIEQVETLLRYDPQPTAWRALVPTSDPGDRVPADARARWENEHQRDEERNAAPTPVPTADERDDLGVPTPAAVRAAPDRLIPEAVRFIGHADRQRHDRAVTSLNQFQNKDARADALRPLLPWLRDPAWSSAPERFRMIQSLENVILPEAEAGLLHVLEHERSSERRAAADALGAMHSTAAADLLRRVSADTKNDDWRPILWARAACGGFSENEALQALEAFARAGDDLDPYSPIPFTARVVSETATITSDSLVLRVLARSAELHREPQVALRLRNQATAWKTPLALDAFLADLAKGQGGIRPLLSHLYDPAALRRDRGQRLREFASGSGASAGLALALLGDHALRDLALANPDAALVASVCAAGRLTGEQPPAAIAAAIDHPSPVVQRAALLWAVETTNPTVRAAIYARQPGQMFILGRMPGWDPGHHTKDGFAGWEERLRHQLRQPDPPTRICALLSGSYWGETGQMVIEERATSARLILAPDRDRFRIRDLSADEFAAFRQTLNQVAVDRLPAAEFFVHDGIQYEHVELDSAGGFRVWMNNPETQPASPWDILVHAWFALGKNTPPVQWPVLDTIVGARVLYDGGVDGLACVAVNGSDGVRILRTHFRHNDDDTGTGWFRLADGKTTPCDRPARWPEIRKPPGDPSLEHRRPWQTLVLGDEVASGSDYSGEKSKSGLWWLRADGPVLMKEGLYRFPLAIPGTTQVVVKTAGEFWLDHPSLQVLDCVSGKTLTCQVPAGDWKPVYWETQRGRMLLEDMEPDERASSDDPAIAAEGEVAVALGSGLRPAKIPRLLWLDPHTGATTPASGDPTPLRDLDRRPLQPVAGREGVVWAALPLRNGTRVGHYDPAQLSFTAVAQVDGLDFSSQECWVDEAGDRLLLSLRGDLLMVPLAGLRLPNGK